MFSSKLVWLLAILLVSPSAIASETSTVAQLLIDRAHYWARMGNRDLELITWKEVLQVEPDNSEALSRIAPGSVVKPNVILSNQMDVAVKSVAVPHVVNKVEPSPVVVDVLAKEVVQDDASRDVPLSEAVSAATKPATASLPIEPAASPVSAVVSAPVEPVSKRGKAVPVEEWSALTAGGDVKSAEPGMAAEAGTSLHAAKTSASNAIATDDATLKAANQSILKKMRVSDATGNVSHRADAQIAVVAKPNIGEEDTSSAIENKAMDGLAAGTSANNQDEVNNIAKTIKPDPAPQDAVALGGEVRGADKKLQQDLLDRSNGVQGGLQHDSLDNHLSENKVVKVKDATIMPVIPYPKMHSKLSTRVLAQAKAKPTARELALKATYWQSRGRADLAEQIRRKIQLSAPEQVISSHPVTQSEVTTPKYTVSKQQSASVSALEDSLLKNPNALKLKLDLVQVYRSIGEIPKARMLIHSLLAESPDLPEALYASAQLYADQHLWMETLHELEKISSVSRTSKMGKLQKSAWAHVQLDRADALARQGRNAEADRVLRQVAAKLVIHDVMMPMSEPPPLWTAPISIKKASAGKKFKKRVLHRNKHTEKRSLQAQKNRR